MLAPSHRGIGSVGTPVLSTPARSSHVAVRVLRRAVMLAVAGLLAGQFGCDNPTHVADKRVTTEVNDTIESQKYSIAKDPPVAAALNAAGEKGQVINASKVAESLLVLGDVKGFSDPESLAAWRIEQVKLTARQRGAIAAAIRAAAREDQKAVRAALATLVEKNQKDTSPEIMIAPIMRQADLEVAAADSLTREASERDVAIGALSADVQQLIGQVRLIAGQVDGLISTSPVQAITYVDQLKAKIEGSDDKADWIGSADAALPTMAKFKAQKAALEAEIAKLEADRTDTESKAKGLRDEAAKMKAEAATKTGKLALDLSIGAADKDLEATKLVIAVEALDSQIASKKGELAIVESRSPAIGVAQKLLDTRRQNLADSWLTTREQLSNLAADVAKLVGPAATPASGPSASEPLSLATPGSTTKPAAAAAAAATPADAKKNYDLIVKESVITTKIAKIKALADEAKQIRDEAGDLYQQALAHVASAQAKAKEASDKIKARKDLATPTAVEQAPFKGLIDFYDARQFDFASAAIETKLGRLGSDKVLGMLIRTDLRAFVQSSLEKQIKPIFTTADDALVKVSEAAKESPAWEKDKLQRTAAFDVLDKMISDLPADQDVTGKAGELEKADGHYGSADTLLNQILGKGDKDGSTDSSSETSSVSKEELLTVVGQTKRAALGLSANMNYSRAYLLKMAGDSKGYDSKLKDSIARTREYQAKYKEHLAAPALPAGAPPEMYKVLNIATTRPTIRPDTQPTAPVGPATNPADGGTGIFGGGVGTPATGPATAPAPTTPTEPGTPGTPPPTTPPEPGAPGTPPPTTPPEPGTPATPAPATPPTPGTENPTPPPVSPTPPAAPGT